MFFTFVVLVLIVILVLIVRLYLENKKELDLVVAQRNNSKPHQISSKHLLLSAKKMAKMIKNKEATSLELVKSSIQQAKLFSHLNALVADRFAAAVEEAKECDRMVEEGREDLPEFHGVPCSIKEAFSVAGMPNSSGLHSRRNVISKEDAPIVANLKKAGFVVIGVSNTSELCMWQESSNPVYGRTTSSHSAKHTSGGSSGGEGALVGSCVVPVGLGSDIGGSIRMPAHFNGVFGLKPSAGLVSNRGQYPVTLEGGDADKFLCSGPFVKRSEDLWPLLKILASPTILVGDPSEIDFKKINVFSVETIGIWLIHPSDELVEAQRMALKCLKENSKCNTQTLAPFSKMKNSLEIWSTLLQVAESESFADKLYGKGNGGVWKGFKEIGKWLIGRSNYTIPAIGLALLEIITKAFTTDKKIAQLKKDAEELRNEIESLLGDDGVLLFPSFPTTTPTHSRPIWLPIQWIYTAIFNTLHFPVCQVPLGLSKEHLPLGLSGVQVVGKRNNDKLVCAIACELERQGCAKHVFPIL